MSGIFLKTPNGPRAHGVFMWTRKGLGLLQGFAELGFEYIITRALLRSPPIQPPNIRGHGAFSRFGLGTVKELCLRHSQIEKIHKLLIPFLFFRYRFCVLHFNQPNLVCKNTSATQSQSKRHSLAVHFKHLSQPGNFLEVCVT